MHCKTYNNTKTHIPTTRTPTTTREPRKYTTLESYYTLQCTQRQVIHTNHTCHPVTYSNTKQRTIINKYGEQHATHSNTKEWHTTNHKPQNCSTTLHIHLKATQSWRSRSHGERRAGTKDCVTVVSRSSQVALYPEAPDMQMQLIQHSDRYLSIEAFKHIWCGTGNCTFPCWHSFELSVCFQVNYSGTSSPPILSVMRVMHHCSYAEPKIVQHHDRFQIRCSNNRIVAIEPKRHET